MLEDEIIVVDADATDEEEEATIQVVEIGNAEPVVVYTDHAFAALGEPNESLQHSLLNSRDIADQHPITAITGLREELDEIESLKTVYSDKVGVANYYEWNDGRYDEVGYFVSLVPHTSSIAICDGADIFGVTVDAAGFIGNQNKEPPRDNSYALVTTSGVVDVRCESTVEEGDCVVSNKYGVAEKTTSGCGYKVIAINEKHGINYASISLGVQACTTDALGKDLLQLTQDIRDAEINIGAAMNVANEAYGKFMENNSVAEEAVLKALEALAQSKEALDATEQMNDVLSSVSNTAEQARAIAEGAVSAANQIRNEAGATANDALDRVNNLVNKFEPIDEWVDPVTGQVGAEYIINYMDNQGLATKVEVQSVESLTEDNKSAIEQNAQNIMMMVSSVDKYSVGEYSQAYGLSIVQARNILSPGMIYIPTPHGDQNTHTESYDGAADRDFTSGFYYKWEDLGDGFGWSESLGQVWFGKEKPSGSAYAYWYDGDTLYLLNDGEWIEVATLAGNVNNRITSMIRQDVDEVRAEIVNAYGGVAGFGAKVSETDAKVDSIASWPTDGKTHNMAVLEQKSDENGSYMVLATVTDVDGESTVTELSGAKIILNDNEKGSFIQLDADAIDLSGYVTITDLQNKGETIINGANIITGTIDADKIGVSSLSAINANIGEVTAGIIKSSNYEADELGNVESGMVLNLTNATWDSKNFKIDDAGDVTVTGNINANAGTLNDMKIIGRITFGGDESYYIDANEGDNSYYVNLPGLKIDKASGAVFSGTLSADVISTSGIIVAKDNISKLNNDSGYQNNDGVVSIINGTVTADFINAKEIKVKAANIDGQLTADQINTTGMVIQADNGNKIDINDGFFFAGKWGFSSGGITCADDSNGHLFDLWSTGMTAKYSSTSEVVLSWSLNDYYADFGSQNNYIKFGEATYTCSKLCGTWTAESDISVTSDPKLKNSVRDIPEKFDGFFDSLRPVMFKYNDGTSGRDHIGLMADEVKLAMDDHDIPSTEFAGYVDNGRNLALRYGEFVPLNILEIQKLKKRVAELESKIVLLEQR